MTNCVHRGMSDAAHALGGPRMTLDLETRIRRAELLDRQSADVIRDGNELG